MRHWSACSPSLLRYIVSRCELGEHADISSELGEHADISSELGEHADISSELGEHADISSELGEHADISSELGEHADISSEIGEHADRKRSKLGSWFGSIKRLWSKKCVALHNFVDQCAEPIVTLRGDSDDLLQRRSIGKTGRPAQSES